MRRTISIAAALAWALALTLAAPAASGAPKKGAVKIGPDGGNILVGGKARGRKLPKPPDDIVDDGDDLTDEEWEKLQRERQNKLLRVAIDTPYQIFEDQGTYVHVAAWRVNGKPAKGASVFVGDVEVGSTDKHGSLVFLYPPKGKKRKSAIGASSVTVVDGAGRIGSVGFSPYLRTESFASDHVFVYTERGVYRPGETVHVRAIAWHLERDYASVKKGELELSLVSDNGNVIGGGTETTDEFGVVSMDIDIPATAELGLYELEVAYNHERQSARLQIRDFEPPAIQLIHTLGRFITADQKGLSFDVTLKPSAGGTIDEATLTVAALANGVQKAFIERDVKGAGPHQIIFSSDELAAIKGALSEGQFATLQLSVRDDRGRTAKLNREMRYTANPYVAVLETDKDQYSTGDPVEIVAKVSDLDGVPQRNTKVTLKVDKKDYEAITDDTGTAVFSFAMGKQTTFVEMYIDGVGDPVADVELFWVEPRPMTSHIRDPRIKEGEKARVTVKFPTHIVPVEDVIHMDVVDTSGALVNAVLLKVNKTKQGYVASGSFSAPSWGSMLLTFFGLGRDTTVKVPKGSHHDIGLLCEGQNLVVHPNRTLEITLDGEIDRASPGADLSMKVRVRDPSGRYVKASVGVAGVDRRVLSLKDPLEITPMDQFYNPELRTMSTTGSKILSWPVVSRNWGPHQMDIALPPFPYKAGGAINDAYGYSGGGYGIGYGSAAGAAYGSIGAKKDKAPNKKAPSKSVDSGPFLDGDSDDWSGATMADPPAPPAEPVGNNKPERPATAATTTITIRTSFPDTFLWEPHLVANKRKGVTVETRLPDAISEQELIIVASDASGGVGILRHRIEVTQPVYAQVDFPETMRAGERVEVPVIVYNNTARADTFALSLKVGGQTHEATVDVPARDMGVALLEVGAPDNGRKLTYMLRASGAGHVDEVTDTFAVLPDGVANATTTSGVASKDAAFETSWTIAADAKGNEAFLSVAFPSITTAFVDAAELDRTIGDDPLSVASDLASAVAVLEYAKNNKLKSGAIDGLEAMVTDAVSWLAFGQNRDGSFAFWRNAKASPYVTAWVLEGLVAADAYGIAVDNRVISDAATYLANSVQPDGWIGVDDVAFWEGKSEAVRIGLTAEVFDVLASVPEKLRTADVQTRLGELADRFADYLKETDIETLAAARAMSGLARMKRLDDGEARRLIEVLLTKRDKGHWEPSWFHAYAGNIEATVAVIVAMQRIDPTGFAREKRDALAWILSTRGAWGSWHNERGTTAAIRALIAVGSPPEEIPGTVTVTVDGKAVETVKINPKDPYMSAIALNHVTLGQHMSAGTHTVRVTYDGKLAPAVSLGVRTWTTGGTTATAGSASAAVRAPETASVGAPIDMRVDVCRDQATRDATSLLIAPSGLVEVDLAQLGEIVAANPGASGYELTDHGVRIDLVPGREDCGVVIPFEATHAGTGQWPSILVDTPTADAVLSAGGLDVSR